MTREMIWRPLDVPGFEHVRLDDGHPEWNSYDSMFFRVDQGEVRRGGYTLIVDKAWRTLELRIMVEQAPGSMAALHLLATGDGAWADADGKRIPELDGCIDVDIQWSPLTNTLPIRRLDLPQDEVTGISVAYISLPDLTVGSVEQAYTRLDDTRVRYVSRSGDFQAEIEVDNEGYVVEYPDIFRREWPSSGR